MKENMKCIVNGQALSKTEFNRQKEYLKASFNQRQMEWKEEEIENLALEQMIGQALLLQEAGKKEIKPSAEKIEQNVENVRSQFSTEEEFNQALESQNMTLEQLEADISKELSVNDFLEQTIPREETVVTEEEISAFYEQYKANAGDQAQSLELVKGQIEQILSQQKVGHAIGKVVEKLKTESQIETFI
ncbi:MAG: hypothetical protein APF84_18525 [Gracilibacter sp. BRH_c7a]|nr:MAG: hypothetical protein APF84_18525 [Gracilibacter sp. BRH_c7a]